MKKGSGMKSAFELAMEKIDGGKGRPSALTAEQKLKIEEVEQEVRAKIAGIEIMSAQHLAEARTAGDTEGMARLETEKVSEVGRLRRQAEKRKREIRGRDEDAP